ncbi:MAG: oligosaccharide flippase family protein [Halobacteriales archaeon]
MPVSTDPRAGSDPVTDEELPESTAVSDEKRHESSAVPDDEREALVSLAHGAVVTGGGVSVRRLLSITTDAALARGLGPVAYGVYALGWRFATMLLRFANLGANYTLMRDLPAYEGDPDRQRRVAGLAYVTTAVASVGIATALFLAADWINGATISKASFPTVLRLFAVLLVVLAFVRMHAVMLRAAKSANGEVLFRRLLRPAARLIGAVGAVALGYSVVGVVGGLIGTLGVLAVFGYPAAVATAGTRPTIRGLGSEARRFYDHAVPSAVGNVGKLLRLRIDVLLIGWLLTAVAAGVYNVVLLVVGLAAIPLMAFNQLMPPVASDLHSSGRTDTLDEVYTVVARLIVTATVPLLAIEAVFGRELLAAFGAEYTQGYAVLLVFLFGRFVANAVGATGILLSMTSHQYAKMGLEWILAALNVLLTYLFVLEFGLIGAAVGTSLAIGFQNFLQAVLLRRFEGLWPFDRTFLKPIGAGIGMGVAMLAVRYALDGALSVVVGTGVGLLAFAGLLLAFGVEPRDRFVVGELTAEYRSVARRRIAAVR